MKDFTSEEISTLTPSDFEIETLPMDVLLRQIVSNALGLANRSLALDRMLRYWLFILHDFQNLYNLTKESSWGWDNMWQLIALGYIHNDIKKVQALFVPIEIHPDEHQSIQIVKKNVIQLSEIQGDPREAIEFIKEMADDTLFFFDNRLEVLIYSFFVGNAMVLRPEKNLPILNILVKHACNWNLQYLQYRLQGMYATIMMHTSKVEQSLPFFDEVIAYADKNNFSFGKHMINNKGIALYTSGRFDEALEIYQRLERKDPNNMTTINNIADIYARKGEMSKSWTYAKRFLEGFETYYLPSVEFIQPVLHELGLNDEFNKFMTMVRNAAIENNIPINDVILLLLEAREARYNLNIELAQEKIATALEMSMEWKNLQIIYLLLIEKINIYIDLAEIRPNENNKQRLFNAVDDLIQLSDDQHVASGSMNGLAMRADIYLSYNNIQKAKEDLYTATKLAKEFGYENLYQKYEQDLEALKNKTGETTSKDGKSKFSKLKEHIRTIVGLNKGNYEEMKYTTHGTILMTKSGLPIFTEYLTDVVKSDSTLISGLVSAVASMLNEAIQSNGFLKTIQRDDFSLLFEPVMDYMIVSVVSADSFDARQHLQNFGRVTQKLLDKYELQEEAYAIPKSFEKEMIEAVHEVLV